MSSTLLQGASKEQLESLVLKEIKGNYAILTLNRPKVLPLLSSVPPSFPLPLHFN